MGWVVVAITMLAGCGASRRVVPAEDAGAGTDGDSDSGSDVGSDSDTDTDTISLPCAVDGDGDRHFAPECGGDDCNDADPSVYPGASDSHWSVEEVTSHGISPAIAIAPDGAVVLLALEDGGITIARKVGDDWSEDSLTDGDRPEEPSVAIDSDGVVHATWIAEGAVRYSSDRGGAFTEIDVDEDCDEGRVRVAVDETGAAYVAYGCADRGVSLATLDGGAPGLETVPGSPDRPSWVALACRSGACHLAFRADGGTGLRYSTNSSGSWVDSLVDGASWGPASIALDAEGRPLLVYPAREVGAAQELRYAVLDAGAWTAQALPTEASSGELAVGPDGATHVIGYTASDGGFEAEWLRLEVDGWTSEPIVYGIAPSFGSPTIAVDAAGVPHVVYEFLDDDFFLGVRHVWRSREDDGVDRDCDGEEG